jgi:hypothetical protein
MKIKKFSIIKEITFENGVNINIGDSIDGGIILEIFDDVIKLKDGREGVVMIEREGNEGGWIVIDLEGNKLYNLDDEDYDIVEEYINSLDDFIKL